VVGDTSDALDLLEQEAARSTEAEFVARHPTLFVSFDAPEDDEDLHFMTELGDVPATKRAVVVAPIAKRAKSPFQDRISVGRTRNSDIVIRDSSVSKLHAHFRVEGANVTLTDVGSHNGTKVDGTRLVPHQPYPIRVGAMLTVGAVAVRIIDARAAYDTLRRR
jgi:hypothetical protein